MKIASMRAVRNRREWASTISEVLASERDWAFDTEYETRGGMNMTVVGMSLAWVTPKKRITSVYVPMNHHVMDKRGVLVRVEKQLTENDVRDGLLQLLTATHKKRRCVMHSLTADLKALHSMRVRTAGAKFADTMIGSWVLETDRRCGHGLKDLTKHFYNHQMGDIAKLAPHEYAEDRSKPPLKSGKRKGLYRLKKTGRLLVTQAPLDAKMIEYGAEDAAYTLKLWYEQFKKPIDATGMHDVYYNLHMEAQEYIAEMEEVGMVIDRPYLEKMLKKLRLKAEKIRLRVFQMRRGKRKGVAFNLGSGKQLNEILFGRFVTGSPKVGITPTDDPSKSDFRIEPIGLPSPKSKLYSTKADIMKQYAANGHKVCQRITKVNKYEHLIGMIEGWLARAVICKDGTWRLFGSVLLHGTRTGRLSSRDPNLQNIPVRDKSIPIRRAFITPRGWLMGDADYEQIELKILAHFSRDKRMLRIMNVEKGDMHSETAIIAYKLKCPPELDPPARGKWVKEHYGTQRGRSKNINFASVYGASPQTLQIKYDIPLAEAEDFLKQHPSIFPGAYVWMDKQKAFAVKHGYVETLFKRKRHLPEAQINVGQWPGPRKGIKPTPEQAKQIEWWKLRNKKKQGALRRAVNSPIQGSAGDIILLAMRNIRRYYMKKGWWYDPINPDSAECRVMPVMQVHDELIFYWRARYAAKGMTKIGELMSNAVTLRVPTGASGSIGDSWETAKD